MRIAPLLAALMLVPASASAWGEYGHRTIAGIAYAESKPSTRQAIRSLLKRSAAVDTPTCKLATIEDASVWPDCVRGLGDRFAYAATWHYQNISVCGDFDIAANCPDGNCVTAQIPRQQAILADRAKPAAERVMALAFLVHFAGDMHQPVHIGDKGDRGANDVKAEYGVKAPPRMNLHRIWDTELAERALTEPPAVGPRSIARADRATWRAGGSDAAAITAWARESWADARDTAYGNLRNYPDKCAVEPTPAETAALAATAAADPAAAAAGPRARIDETYIAAATPVVRARVEAAGVRLALLLDAAFGRAR